MKMHNDIFGEKGDISRIVDRVYDTGYDKGYRDRQIEEEFDEEDSTKAIEEAYQNGLDDAWECAKKIAATPSDGGFSVAQLVLIFNQDFVSSIMAKYSASEAIAKIKKYEEKKKADDEIKVGDEVYLSSLNAKYPRTVLSLFADNRGRYAVTVLPSGRVDTKPVDSLTKTGRHFDIQSILDQMKKEAK